MRIATTKSGPNRDAKISGSAGICALLCVLVATPSPAESVSRIRAEAALAAARAQFSDFDEWAERTGLVMVESESAYSIAEAHCIAKSRAGVQDASCAPVYEAIARCGPRGSLCAGERAPESAARVTVGAGGESRTQRRREIEEVIRNDRLMRGEPMM